MSCVIRISDEIYKRLGDHADAFEKPGTVIKKLLDFYEKHNIAKAQNKTHIAAAQPKKQYRRKYKRLTDYMLPAIKLIMNDENNDHIQAFKSISQQLNVEYPTVSSQCTRSYHISTEQFLREIKSGEIINRLCDVHPQKAEFIKQELL